MAAMDVAVQRDGPTVVGVLPVKWEVLLGQMDEVPALLSGFEEFATVGEGEAMETAKEEGRTLSQTQQLVTVTCGEEGAEPVLSQDLPGSVS